MRWTMITIAFIASPAVLTSTAEAGPVTFNFEGSVSRTNKPTVFPIGQEVEGSYTFDSTTPDANPGNPDQGLYTPVVSFNPYTPPTKGVTRFSFTSGSYSAAAFAPNVVNGGGQIIVNRLPSDNSYQVFFQRISDKVAFPGQQEPKWGPDVNGEELVRIWLDLQDTRGTAIKTKDLPLTPPNLNDFTSAAFGLFFESDATGPAPPAGGGVVFTVTSLTSSSLVPEPPTALLLAAGIAGIAACVALGRAVGVVSCEASPRGRARR